MSPGRKFPVKEREKVSIKVSMNYIKTCLRTFFTLWDFGTFGIFSEM